MNKCYDPITSPCTIIIQLLFYSALQMFHNKKDYGFVLALAVILILYPRWMYNEVYIILGYVSFV